MERRIARVEGTMLGWEDHGILTCWLDLNYGRGGGHQSTPAYFLTRVGVDFIERLMLACGVRKWEELRGRTIIALIEDDVIVGVEPLPTEQGQQFLFADREGGSQ